MNRFKKYLATAALLVLPILAACGEDVMPPAATGSIAGQVSIEGMGIDGVSVNLSSGASTTTAGGGTYRFDGVEAGAYTVTISGFPADASFDATSAAATIPETGGSVTLDFRGSYIRTASIMGTVTIENTGIGGITVLLSGMADAQTATDSNGQYAFTGLRSGTYSVEISGFDSDEVGFGSLESSATVGVGESKIISFDGTYLRTAGIEGRVSIEGEGLSGVTVSLGGSESGTTTTDAGGRYAFAKLKEGVYTVAISGYDADDYEFESTSESVTLATGETANVPFEGTLLRTAGISGRVSVGGMGLAGVTVSLSGMDDPREATTNAQGQYGFAGLAEGTYVLSMTNPDAAEYSFETERSVTVARSESKIENFEGTSLRTAGVAGMVTVEGSGVSGATVTLIRVTGATSGDVIGIKRTGDDGSYAFGDLLAGIYRVGISGFDAEYAFETTNWQGQVATGDVADASFAGTIIRTASIGGMVTVDGSGKEGVTVTLAGGTDGIDADPAMTGTDGGYMFDGLRRGDYTVTITNPDEARYSFTATERRVSVGVGQTQGNVSFAGTLLREAGISGRVSAGGMGLPDVTVSLSGMDDPRETTTNAQGQYGFAGLAEGAYTVAISGYDAAEYAFEAEQSVTLTSQTEIVNFEGTSLRTAGVAGMVTVEESGVAGVTVTLSRVTGATTGDVIGIKRTGDDGSYAFGDLLAGIYRVEISGFDAEYAFETTNWQGQVPTGDVADASFAGTIIRTASIGGMVTVEGSGKEGVTVSLAGGTDGVDDTAMTGADGGYMFDGLRRGDYTVTITNPDEALYSFTVTERRVSVGIGQPQGDVSFAGTMLRQGSISGRVHAEGTAIVGATVTLAGGAVKATRETDDQGNYAFTDLGPGTYVVSVTNPDEVKYDAPESTSENVTLDSADGKATVNFAFAHTLTASVTGKAFVDEAAQDKMYTANEPALEGMEIPLTLQGPDVNREVDGKIGMDGSYAFEGLRAGTYRVLVDLTAEVRDGLEEAGYEFAGDVVGEKVTVAAGGMETVNFPFRITMQTISVSANMGSADGAAVPGVELALYANADMTGMLDEEQMTNETGVAVFNFARAMNTGPGGNDNLVFVNMKSVGADNAGLEVSGNEVIEVSYPGVARVHAAGAAVTLLNTAVKIQFSVKSNMDARGGDMGLEGWAAEYCMPMADDAATTDADESVVCTGDDATFTAMTDADGDPDLTAADGKGTLSFTADVANLPAMVYVRAADDQADKLDYGEKYKQTDMLMHSHDGLILPADNDPSMNTDELDKGPIYITYETQSIYVGAHRELDDRTGLTDYIGVGDGDARPSGHAKGKIKVRLMKANDRGRLEQYTYDDDNDPKTDDADAEKTFSDANTVRFKYVDATAKIVVVADAGSNMTIVPDDRSAREIDAYGDGLDNFPDGIMAGAFGDNSGGRPDVWICPLQRQEDAEENCSTFAYKWEDGTIKGAVGGLQEDDEDVVVALEARRSNPDYESDFAKDDEIDFDEDGPAEYSFRGVADGKYRVILPGVAGKWAADSTAVLIEIAHKESADGGDHDTGAVEYTVDTNLSATQLRYAIQGIVGNDRSDPTNGLSRSETRSGVTLNLHYASKKKARAPNKNTRTMLGAVMDADGNAMTTETDSDGNYEFTGLRSDTVYVVAAVSEEGHYKVVRKRGDLLEERDDHMYSEAVVSATAHDPDFPDDATTPSWNHATGMMGTGGRAEFALLFEDATVEGTVSDPSANKAHKETVVELHRCLTPPPLGLDGTRCGKLVEGWEVKTVAVGANGDWFEEDFLEGHYEVTLDLPQGYDNSGADGTTTTGAGYFESQAVALINGSGTPGSTMPFHIVNRRGGTMTEQPNAVVASGSKVFASSSATATVLTGDAQFVTYDTKSVDVTLTNVTTSADAVLHVVTVDVPADNDNDLPFESGVKGNWPVESGGNVLSVRVKAGNGYGADVLHTMFNTADQMVDVHRDRNTKLNTLEVDALGTADDSDFTRAGYARTISSFTPLENQRSTEIGGNETTSNTTVGLSSIAVSASTTSLTLRATGVSTDVTFAYEGSNASTGVTVTTGGIVTLGDAGTAASITVTITITDNVRGANARSYTVRITRRAS